MRDSVITYPHCGAPLSPGRPMPDAHSDADSSSCESSVACTAGPHHHARSAERRSSSRAALLHVISGARPIAWPDFEGSLGQGGLRTAQKSRLDRRWLCRCIPIRARWRPQGRRDRSTVAAWEVWQEGILDGTSCQSPRRQLFQGFPNSADEAALIDSPSCR